MTVAIVGAAETTELGKIPGMSQIQLHATPPSTPLPTRVLISHRPLVGVKKLLGFTSLTAMSMIVPMADCAGRALAGLLAPCRARAPSTVHAFGREHAHRAKILRDHHGPW